MHSHIGELHIDSTGNVTHILVPDLKTGNLVGVPALFPVTVRFERHGTATVACEFRVRIVPEHGGAH